MSNQERPTLSLCMIVRNESRFLADCLSSVRDVVDQIVVVDTGSTDNTVEIAKKFGAEVHHFEWCDHFAAARNASIQHATGDWILWMDADERLWKESRETLLNELTVEKEPVMVLVQIASVVKAGQHVHMSTGHRLFTNHHGIYFSGRIHEQISPSVSKMGGKTRNSKIILDHLGYDNADQALQDHKRLRNRKLLEQMAEECPDSAYAHFTLAQHYVLSEEIEKSLPHFQKGLDLDQFDKAMTVSLYNAFAEACMKVQDLDKAEDLLRYSLKLQANQIGGYYLSYRVAMERGEHASARKYLLKLAEQNRRTRPEDNQISTDIIINESQIDFELGQLALREGNFEEALTYLEKVLPVHPENTRLLRQLAELYLKTQRLSEARTVLCKLWEKEPENAQVADLLSVVLIKMERFREASMVLEKSLAYDPTPVLVRRLAGIYAKGGDQQRALNLLQTLPQ
ncbi:MAG TPA: tetratricopeptide repeat protein [Calditrichia bacterium]|nr:tetratricopeptide repeat protein [Calditrichota bacterium]HQV30275.1 tetratricopeptide repeat protein [Calditrichia bacterium]